jgi:ribonuclease BN (tRNA processing enzyme)
MNVRMKNISGYVFAKRISIVFFLLFTTHTVISAASLAGGACDKVSLQILGEGGPEINDGLASSSYLVWINNRARVLVDAGGGSSFNFEKTTANFNDLEVILFTHLHVDHTAALPVYLKAGYFSGRQKNLSLYGPDEGGNFPSTENFVKALISDRQLSVYPYLSDNLYPQSTTDFLLLARTVKAKEKIWLEKINNNLLIKAISVKHGPVPALAWRVESDGCSITFSGDMNGSTDHLAELALNTDILVAHNAIPQQANSFAKKLHMTPLKIGEIAAASATKKLVLSHFMLRTRDNKRESKELIRQSYQGEIIQAKALMKIQP